MKKQFLVLSLLFFGFGLKAQILIEGTLDNKIYSSIENTIELVNFENCQSLEVEIEGFEDKFELQDCRFSITHLRKDTSKIWIINSSEVIYEQILIKAKTQAVSYLNLDGERINKGTITKEQLEKMTSLDIIYNCPWVKTKVKSFELIITKENETSHFYTKVIGNKFSNEIIEEIKNIENPKRLYIEGIDWIPVSCFESMNSIILDIK